MSTDYSQWLEKFQKDHFATKVVGVEVIVARPGYAKTMLRIDTKHYNAVGIVQGGALFTLSDFTFAVACHIGHDDTLVAIECNISFLKPVSNGIIYGEAKLIAESKSLAYYEVEVTNEAGDLIAKFHSRAFKRQNKNTNTNTK
ncbi:MAG: PaaI family thioesterase [Planctomycetaceae bacterium]|jgi:acyl-CoA thioesterase|nr:PaaI family thioesterase [Planctomycetaceae bacterium]